MQLGALGKALLPYERSPVLFIDGLDKGDIDLANDLLDAFEAEPDETRELVRSCELEELTERLEVLCHFITMASVMGVTNRRRA
ncbi:hypothetical protein [Streptosporangium sp. NPDC023615]|uniref:hypothetical protein n=1 Tax=Streptosporangium sp. NPDC023615 TaxID=3154794 RepID=UPI0034321A28